MADYILDNESLNFLVNATQATNQMNNLKEVLTNPVDFADKYKLAISPNVEGRLLSLGEINADYNFQPDDPINTEIVNFFNKTVIDGRYIQEWYTDPVTVARNLDLNVSNSATDRIISLRFDSLFDIPEVFQNNSTAFSLVKIVVVIIVCIIILAVGDTMTESINMVVIDKGAPVKL